MELFNSVNITLSGVWFTFILAAAGPIITGFVTKRFADSTTKTYVLIGVTVVLQSLTELGQAFNLGELLTKIFIAFFIAVGLHYQLLKPAGITGSQGIVNKILPDAGIGGNYPNTELPEAEGGPGDDTYTGPDLSDPANPAQP